MRSLIDQLSQYGAYHRDARNVATHYVGVPMIMWAIVLLLSRPVWWVGAMPVTPALLGALASCVFYFRLDMRYGVVLALSLAAMLASGQWLAGQSTLLWLTSGLGLFAMGWMIQLIGHAYEGRKPAFVDDIIGLLIGPLFVVAKIGFVLGFRLALKTALQARAAAEAGTASAPAGRQQSGAVV